MVIHHVSQTAWKTIFKIIIIETWWTKKTHCRANSRRSSSILKTTGVTEIKFHQFVELEIWEQTAIPTVPC